MKKLNPYLQKQLKKQMLIPIIKCEMFSCFCRFAISGYCLEEHKLYACDYAVSGRKEVATFGKRGTFLLTLRKDETRTSHQYSSGND